MCWHFAFAIWYRRPPQNRRHLVNTCRRWQNDARQGSGPAVEVHASAITSGCSGWSRKSNWHAASWPASDKCCVLRTQQILPGSGISVTASLKRFITFVKCGFIAPSLRRLIHFSQTSAMVAVSDCNQSNAFATGCSWAWRVLASFSRPVLWISDWADYSLTLPLLLMPVKCEEWLSLLRDDACNVVDVDIKWQMESVATSDKHGTETTSPATEFSSDWMSL